MTTTKSTLPETQRKRRGHQFYPTKSARVPALGSTEGQGDAAMVRAHYFVGGSDWWITEWDPATGEAFGFACLNGDTMNAELGYIDLRELEAVRVGGWLVVERDKYFDPITLGEVKRKVGRI